MEPEEAEVFAKSCVGLIQRLDEHGLSEVISRVQEKTGHKVSVVYDGRWYLWLGENVYEEHKDLVKCLVNFCWSVWHCYETRWGYSCEENLPAIGEEVIFSFDGSIKNQISGLFTKHNENLMFYTNIEDDEGGAYFDTALVERWDYLPTRE